MELTGAIGYPLSPQQELAWQTLAGTPAQHASVLVRIAGAIDSARLRRALTAVVARHEILRTEFVAQTGRRLPLQVIRPDAAVLFHERDLRGADEREQMREVDAIRRELLADPCDGGSTAAPRAALITLRDQKHLLVLVAPAMCADAETLQVLVAQAAQAYAGAAAGEDPVQYADFSEWQRQELDSTDAAAAAARERWAQSTNAADDLPFLGDAALRDDGPFSAAAVDTVLDRDVADAVDALARSAGVPVDRV
ncbi:MAG TPA: condensation domain-containing protein, partial [Vicinamibacterales bacterium]|nr:condensation domain-containing protein [Vicinamibacterales bacterium]